jgi:type II secretory pathway pseudopilin PulG
VVPIFEYLSDRSGGNVRKGGDEGESLVEIVIALVLIGLVLTALMAALATAARASKSQRDLVKVDTVMRGYAESVKNEVRTACSNPATGLYGDAYAPPSGFTVSQSLGRTCPAPTAVLKQTLTVVGSGVTRTLEIEVRRP